MHTKSFLGIAPEVFLADYWQKKPLLVRQAFPGGIDLVDGDLLAGLACQEGVESRIVREHGPKPWETRFGPFEEGDFAVLPASHWTLLVQAVDRLLPEVSALKQAFAFIPNWRLDDIMISYAADQGSVGPHLDHYDVFLIQGQGRRRWGIGERPILEPDLLPDIDLKILRSFIPDVTHELEPGDMLYLPPGFGHHGMALGSCITYSVGFRAPTQKEMLLSFAQYLAQHLADDIFYADPQLKSRKEPGQILPAEIDGLQKLLWGVVDHRQHYLRWLGGYLTEPRSFHSPAEEPIDEAQLSRILEHPTAWMKGEGVRMAYYVEAGSLYFAVEGECLVLDLGLEGLVQTLCREQQWSRQALQLWSSGLGFAELMCHLWNQGYVREAADLE